MLADRLRLRPGLADGGLGRLAAGRPRSIEDLWSVGDDQEVAPDRSAVPSRAALIGDLKLLRARGLLRLPRTELPALQAAAVALGLTSGDQVHLGVERLLRTAVEHLGEEELGRAAQYLFGLVQGTAGRRPTDLRAAAAEAFGHLSPETFRKRHEPLLLGRIADEILLLVTGGLTRPPPGPDPDLPPGVHRDLDQLDREIAHGVPDLQTRRFGPYEVPVVGRLTAPVVVDWGAVEQLRDVQVITSSENTYLLPARPFSSTLSGHLRRAAARRAVDGELVDDVVVRELEEWLRKHARPGWPVEPGVVVATSAGALEQHGVLAVLHAAVAIPRDEAGGYDVQRMAIARAVPRCFELARDVRRQAAETVESISFPLFGAGDGGVGVAEAASWCWTAVRHELAYDLSWRVHLTTWTAAETRAVLAQLAAEAA